MKYWFKCEKCDKRIKRDPNSIKSDLVCLKCREKEKPTIVKCKQCQNDMPAYDKHRHRRYFCSPSCSSIHGNTGKKLSQETRDKISQSVSLSSPGIIKTKFYPVDCPYLQDKVNVQGTWEYKYALWLNENKINWIKDKKNNFIYTDDEGHNHRYYPDFYLPDSDEYIEIKGVWWGNDKKKMENVFKCNPNANIIILEGKKLTELGINVFDYSKHRTIAGSVDS